MKLTRGGEYGIRGVLYLARQEEGKVSMLSAIAKAQDVPPRFLAKGGFSLAKPSAEITIKDVIEAVEGPIHLNVCLIGDGECERGKLCAMHPIWEDAQEKMVNVLARSNFADLVKAERQAETAAS